MIPCILGTYYFGYNCLVIGYYLFLVWYTSVVFPHKAP